MMIDFLLVAVLAVLGAYLGHVILFGLRTRHTDLHGRPRTRRDEHDRQWAGIWERHPRQSPNGHVKTEEPPSWDEGSACTWTQPPGL